MNSFSLGFGMGTGLASSMNPGMMMGGGGGIQQLFIMMQMMQMMQMLMSMMGGGQFGMPGQFPGGMGPQMGMMMGNQMGMPMMGAPMQMPWPNGGCACPGYGGGGQSYPPLSCNPGAQIPNFGPNPNKQQIGAMIEAAAQKYGVPPQIAKAVAYQESGFRANASSFDGGHGKGVMQIDDRSHAFARTQQVWDPASNIDYGVRLLADNYKRCGDWQTAVRMYNGSGPAARAYSGRVMNLAQSQPWRQWGVA